MYVCLVDITKQPTCMKTDFELTTAFLWPMARQICKHTPVKPLARPNTVSRAKIAREREGDAFVPERTRSM